MPTYLHPHLNITSHQPNFHYIDKSHLEYHHTYSNMDDTQPRSRPSSFQEHLKSRYQSLRRTPSGKSLPEPDEGSQTSGPAIGTRALMKPSSPNTSLARGQYQLHPPSPQQQEGLGSHQQWYYSRECYKHECHVGLIRDMEEDFGFTEDPRNARNISP